MFNRLLALCAAALLAACGTPAYTPYTVEIQGAHGTIDCTKAPDSATGFCVDLKACQQYAAAYRQSLSARRIVQSGGTAAIGNAPTAVVSSGLAPFIIGAGVVSGAGNELAGELGVIDFNIDKITGRCLHDKSMRSGAYLVIDPNY